MDRELTIPIPGAEIHAQRRGAVPRAVFVHGFGSDLHSWDRLWASLGERLPALRYDLRGYGRSHTMDEAPFDHAEDLRAILDGCGIACCDLVGLSMGGGIALHFALESPERVRRLVLISPALVAWEWSGAWRELWRPIIARARSGRLDEARRLWWEHPLFESTRGSAAAAELHASIQRFAGRQWIRDPQRPMAPDVERLHRLTTPTLLLTGGRDVEDFRLIAELITASAPSVQRIDAPALGHLLHLEDPEACAQRIIGFLDRPAAA